MTEPHIHCHLADLLQRRQMSLAELSRTVGITVVNLSVLKNQRASAVRFSTLLALCQALDCQPGDLFSAVGTDAPSPAEPSDPHTPPPPPPTTQGESS